MRLKTIRPDVHIAKDVIVSVGRADIRMLEQSAAQSARHRSRICAHKDNEDRLHEMFIVFTKDTYVRPSKHIGKDESLHVLEGAADYVFFDNDGHITDVVRLGDHASGLHFYCRVPREVYHTLIVRSDILKVHETTQGPFRREDTVFADWGPEDADAGAIATFIKKIEAELPAFIGR